MGDPQGDLRPGTPILVGFFTQISKKWVLDSKTPLVAPPRGGGVTGKNGLLLLCNIKRKNEPSLCFFLVFFFLEKILLWGGRRDPSRADSARLGLTRAEFFFRLGPTFFFF